MEQSKTKKLVECALLVAIATVLSVFKLVELPYGGSVTMASMLPILLIAYRHGAGWGVSSGLVYAVVQCLFGLKNVFYFTDWVSVVAVILLDYILAFVVIGLGGVWRRVVRTQALALSLGALTVCCLRYACHVVSGCTVWAGLSIPTTAALGYSFIYNATYMIPECIVLTLATYYLGSVLDFRVEMPTRMQWGTQNKRADGLLAAAGAVGVGGLIAVVAFLFGNLQNGETGEFDVTVLTSLGILDWVPTLVVSVVTLSVVVTLLFLRRGALRASHT